MAVQYAPMKLRVPPGFQNLLEGLAREVLREQPEDIINFAAQYFRNQLLIREGMLFAFSNNERRCLHVYVNSLLNRKKAC